MQLYGKHESLTHYDIKALLYVQKVELDKFRQELSLSTIYTNISLSNSKQYDYVNKDTIMSFYMFCRLKLS